MAQSKKNIRKNLGWQVYKKVKGKPPKYGEKGGGRSFDLSQGCGKGARDSYILVNGWYKTHLTSPDGASSLSKEVYKEEYTKRINVINKTLKEAEKELSKLKKVEDSPLNELANVINSTRNESKLEKEINNGLKSIKDKKILEELKSFNPKDEIDSYGQFSFFNEMNKIKEYKEQIHREERDHKKMKVLEDMMGIERTFDLDKVEELANKTRVKFYMIEKEILKKVNSVSKEKKKLHNKIQTLQGKDLLKDIIGDFEKEFQDSANFHNFKSKVENYVSEKVGSSVKVKSLKKNDIKKNFKSKLKEGA